MNFIHKDQIEWKKVKYLKEPWQATDEEATWKYEFWMNEPLASWDVFAVWEKERIASMERHLKKGDILFDIGTESGWCNLVYADMVGPENMVLIEPTQEFWPNIKALWEKNYPGVKPKGFYAGLLSDKTKNNKPFLAEQWPTASNGDLIDSNKYQYIHDNTDGVPEMKLDDYVMQSGIVPDALTMDTEGSEFLILMGADLTLKKHKPKLWVSIHPDMALRDYQVKNEDIHGYLTALGYTGELLATDHEEHWYFHV